MTDHPNTETRDRPAPTPRKDFSASRAELDHVQGAVEDQWRAMDDATNVTRASTELDVWLARLTDIRDHTDRANPAGRELSLAITHLEDAIGRLRKALDSIGR